MGDKWSVKVTTTTEANTSQNRIGTSAPCGMTLEAMRIEIAMRRAFRVHGKPVRRMARTEGGE